MFLCADAHEFSLKQTFDIIILSDLVNDLWDLQRVLECVHRHSHAGTRIILNFFNNLWRIPLGIVKKLGMGAETLEQNWFSPGDVRNLLNLSGFEVIGLKPCVLLPLEIPFLSAFLNRFVSKIPPFSWFSLTNIVTAKPVVLRDSSGDASPLSVTVVIPARNEAGNMEEIIQRVPAMGRMTEIIFVEGHSKDNTYEAIEKAMALFPAKVCRLFRQTGRGKGDAVRLGFEKATGDILMILDADMTVPPEDLDRFFNALVSGKGEFINGVRLVYPMQDRAMRFFNMLGNKFFSLAFSWLLDQPVKDALCGTKVLRKEDYEIIAANRSYFGEFDPFGDFDLLFGAAKMNLKIVDMPVRYQSRRYGDTNISRWRHGWLLIRMVIFAAKRIKFI